MSTSTHYLSFPETRGATTFVKRASFTVVGNGRVRFETWCDYVVNGSCKSGMAERFEMTRDEARGVWTKFVAMGATKTTAAHAYA